MLPTLRAKINAKRGNWLHGGFELRLLFSILVAGAAGVALSLLLLWRSSYSLDHKTEVSALILLLWLGLSFSARDRVVNSLRVLYNVISAVKDEDFRFAPRRFRRGCAWRSGAGDQQSLPRSGKERLGAVEATNLMRR
jgi:hypothetical protein